MKNLLTLLSVFIFAFSGFSANRYWVNVAASNWNNTANWSTVSGGAGGASVPGSGDIAIFDANALGGCAIDANVNVLGFTISAGYTGLISQGANTITIGSSNFSQADGLFLGGSA